MRGGVATFEDFRGGLNTRDSSYAVKPNQARDLLNVVGRTYGAIRSRYGVQLFATPGNPYTSLFGVEATSSKYLIAASPVGAGFRSIDTAGTTASLGGTPGTARWAWMQAATSGGQGPVYGMNGTNTPVYWTGAGNVANWTASTGTLPNGKYLAYVNGRVWVAGMASYGTVNDPGSTLVFSNVRDPRDWPTANVVQFDPRDGDAITGVAPAGPYLLVFKRHKVFRVYDLDTGANVQLSSDIGAVAPDSIVSTPQGVYFLHSTGVHLCDGNTIKPVSEIVSGTIRAIPDAVLPNAVGAYLDEHYYLAFSSTGGVNNRMLDLDVRLDSWWLHSVAAQSMAVWRVGEARKLYVADPTVARIGKAFESTANADYGTAFSTLWDQGWTSPSKGGAVIRHRLRGVRCDVSGKVSMSLARDFVGAPTFVKTFDYTAGQTTFGGTDTFGGGGTFGDPPGFQQGKAPSQGVGRAFSVRFSSTESTAWEVENFAIMLTDRKS